MQIGAKCVPTSGSFLVTMGLLSEKASIDALRPTEQVFGFRFAGPLPCRIRQAHSATCVMQGSLITKNTLKRRPEFMEACIKRHLSDLPNSVKLVVVLGATTDYVADVMEIMGGVPEFSRPKLLISYRVGATPLIHVPHPSGATVGPSLHSPVKAICRQAGCSWQNRTAPTRFPAPCGDADFLAGFAGLLGIAI
jgi:hypothetical protein